MESLNINRADRIWMASMKFCSENCGCHQMPERSFFVGKYQFPLCARCTGIAIGHIFAILVSLSHSVPPAGALCMIPLVLDGTIQKLTRYESTNSKRVVTGILYGFGAMSTVIGIVRELCGRIVHLCDRK